jgi:8-hydroxy-5-deazaflavin:NADPH oxidoreductase
VREKPERPNCFRLHKSLCNRISPVLTVGFNSSAAEQVSGWAQGARGAKVFNTTGANNMENSSSPGGAPVMFYCSDDAGAKAAARQLATDLGFEAIDAGSLTTARLLEAYAMLWIHLAYAQNLGRDFAFRIVRQ